MIVRGWHVVVPATVLAWVLHGWGSGVVVYLLGWWAPAWFSEASVPAS